MSVLAAAEAAVAIDVTDFEVEFVDTSGCRCRAPLSASWPARFEDVGPVRGFRWSKGQCHWPGWWWSATSGRHVGYESWLERDHVMLLDFDRDVVGFASQPFWLHWRDERVRRHAPDFFARLRDGTGVVIDVRADERIEPSDAAAFAAMARACEAVGWEFRRVGVPDLVRLENVRWLSRYRRSRCGARTDIASRLLEVFEQPRALFDGAGQVGDRLVVLPVLYHLMWRQRLVTDLGLESLHANTVVRTTSGGAW
ncbi:MAG TPA: TnsA-like heteromeric transposase endonuclease subunit [Pseudonocardiaceae bacterium]|nr:TnsA-like heteromeric transposase endonuclease subunit [Pseudonocardiaceae bacterium]